MKKILIISIAILCAQLAVGQEKQLKYKAFIREADSLFILKEYEKAGKKYTKAFSVYDNKGAIEDRYKAARAYALAGNTNDAFENLQRLADKIYFSDYDRIVAETDFTALHNDKRWQPLIVKIVGNRLPTGWYRAGSKPEMYQMRLDSTSESGNKKVLTIKSTQILTGGFGTLMQSFDPNKYLGKRIRMTGFMRSQDVESWAGFWLRVDPIIGEVGEKRKSLSFDNMHDRPIKGTTVWKKYEIVLDVPQNAGNISFGALLDGGGQIWFEGLSFEIVDASVPKTGKREEPNLDFGK